MRSHWLNSARARAWLWQALVVAAVVALLSWLAHNAALNLEARGIRIGIDFLERAARFPISQSLVPYTPVDSFAWALFAGLGNTLSLSFGVIMLATGCGFGLALARRSAHPLAQGMASTYVEAIRNTPLVVQLLFWYALFTEGLPDIHSALEPLPGVFLTNRGLYFPALTTAGIDVPHLERFNFAGGVAITPELAAIALGLVLYSTAFIGEVIRGGIDAVASGQWEAGRSLGLSDSQTLRRIILPQALRVVIPPLTSQYINVIKNTTLALVVGYPDFAFVIATTINQTGQAVEGILLLMAVFLSVNGLASWLMNWCNRRFALVGG